MKPLANERDIRRTAVIASLCTILFAAPAFASSTDSFAYGRLGLGLSVAQDFAPIGPGPLVGVNAIGGGGLTFDEDLAGEFLADFLLVGGRIEGELTPFGHLGLHGGITQFFPSSDGLGFVTGGAGLGAGWVAEDLARLGGSVIVGAGWNLFAKGMLPIGVSAYYTARVLAEPLGFVHAIHANINVFLPFTGL